MSVSELYFRKTNHKSFYYITPIKNVSSIMEHGILSHELVAELPHTDISLSEVQARRSRVVIPNGLRLHQYANLYFDYRNPMLYKRKAQANELCILAIDRCILDRDGCIVTDRNAAADTARFYSPQEGLDYINFRKVFAQSWYDDNPSVMAEQKRIKCAEVLVPGYVPSRFIRGAYVNSDSAKQELLKTGFARDIVVYPRAFFEDA